MKDAQDILEREEYLNMTCAQLIEERMRLTDEVTSVRDQLQRYRAGETPYRDETWRRRAESVIRFRVRDLNRVAAAFRIQKQKEHQQTIGADATERKRDHARMFLKHAVQMLPEEVFNRINERARAELDP